MSHAFLACNEDKPRATINQFDRSERDTARANNANTLVDDAVEYIDKRVRGPGVLSAHAPKSVVRGGVLRRHIGR